MQMIIDDKVLYGDSAAAGEIGHMVVQRDGPVCPTCGGRGCLEALAGERAVLNRCREAMEKNSGEHLWQLCSSPELLTMDQVLQAQADGDETVETMIQDALDYLGIALSNAVNLISPKAVVIDGRMFRLEKNQRYLLWLRSGTCSGYIPTESNLPSCPLTPIGEPGLLRRWCKRLSV